MPSRRNITSDDPRKRPIVETMKKKAGATRITVLKETLPGVFKGNAYTAARPGTPRRVLAGGFSIRSRFESIGCVIVTAREAGLSGLHELRLSTVLSEAEIERIRALIERGPLTYKDIDARLLTLGWVRHYHMIGDEKQDAVEVFENALLDFSKYKVSECRKDLVNG